jgi:predicted Zn finger-like uncharacterized protein
MHVNCEQCNTTYRLDSGLVKELGTKVRCSMCKHVFIVYPETKNHLSACNDSEKPDYSGFMNDRPTHESVVDEDLGYLEKKESRIKENRVDFSPFIQPTNSLRNLDINSRENDSDNFSNDIEVKLNEDQSLETDVKNDEIEFVSAGKGSESTDTSENFDQTDIFENFKNNNVISIIEDPDYEAPAEYSETYFVPTLDGDLGVSFSGRDQDIQEAYGWNDFDYEPDEFDDKAQVQDFGEVDADKGVPGQDRALQMAMEIGEKYGWAFEEVKLLGNVFNDHGWSFTRNSIINELKLGMKFYEFQFAVEIRKIWQSHSEFSTGYSLFGSFGDNSLKYKSVYINPEWSFCLNIVRRFDAIPDPEEMEHHLVSLYTKWKFSSVLQDQHISYYDYIRGIVDSGDAPFL